MSLNSNNEYSQDSPEAILDASLLVKGPNPKYIVINVTESLQHCERCSCEKVESIGWEIQNTRDRDFLSEIQNRFTPSYDYEVVAFLSGEYLLINNQTDFYSALLIYLNDCYEGCIDPMNMQIRRK